MQIMAESHQLREMAKQPSTLAGLTLGVAAGPLLIAIVRHPAAAMNCARELGADVVWTWCSWKRPAGRASYWQQQVGKRTDPYDRLRRGI